MARMKKFLIYALIIIVFYLFSSFLIKVGMKANYRTIEYGKILVNAPKVEVAEAKATYINGYVEGKITNNTESRIDNKYIKIDLYSKHNTNLGTKYIKIQNLDINQTRDFRIAFKFTDVNAFEITMTDDVQNATEEQFISDEMKTGALFATLILMCII